MVQSITFKTGAVSLSTLPLPTVPEAAIIGRSNVGKSSLINYVVGRKAMAYTSKTPGKTQQVLESFATMKNKY
jgi:GTP-binding protein